MGREITYTEEKLLSTEADELIIEVTYNGKVFVVSLYNYNTLDYHYTCFFTLNDALARYYEVVGVIAHRKYNYVDRVTILLMGLESFQELYGEN